MRARLRDILLYHLVTDQTGVPSQEWPPTGCGSNGLYVLNYLLRYYDFKAVVLA